MVIIAPEQCRAARAWLGWQQVELAEAANVSLSTVRDFEAGRRQPMANNAAAIVSAFTKVGVAMVFEGGEPRGIRTTGAPRPTTRPRERPRPAATRGGPDR